MSDVTTAGSGIRPDLTNEPDAPAITATVSLDDGWVRVYLSQRLDRDEFDALAQATGLRWRRSEGCLAGAWTPAVEDVLHNYGVLIEEENVDLRAVAERRAAHYARWAEGAADRAAAAHAVERDILDAIPMGQPILVGHHSEARHRRDLARADRLIRRALDERERAEHWEERAETTLRHAARRYTAEQLTARINLLETARRGYARRLAGYEETLAWRPMDRAAGNGRDYNLRLIAFTDRRIAYARQLLDEAEATAGNDVSQSVAARLALAIEVGGGVSTDAPDDERQYWWPVLKINKKTIKIGYWLGISHVTENLPKEKIKQAMPAAEWAGVEKWPAGPGLRIRPRPGVADMNDGGEA